MGSNGISLAEALEILGPIRAWVSEGAEGVPVYWLDGKSYPTDRAIKREAHKLWVQQQK